jgi:hypothetical protein
VSSERDPYFAFPALRGAPAYARPPKPTDDVTRPFDPDDLPLAAEQSEEEGALLRELGQVGRYQPHLMLATAARPGPGAGADGPGPARRLSLRSFTDLIRPKGS